jgi:cysteinyl-tRNA synthetase
VVLAAAAGLLTLSAPASGLSAVHSWGYQLQPKEGARLDLPALAKSPFDLLVIDYADGDRPLTAGEVAKLKARAGTAEPRVVLAYLSIGEAEDYRFYWEPSWKSHPPAFVARQNPGWRGNFKVRFWDPAWQKIVLAYLDRIIDAGFDGAYLDIIDAYEFFGPEGTLRERPTAAKDMRAFVERLAAHARVERGRDRPRFYIVPQNGSGVIDDAPRAERDAYLAAIDAVGAEDTFFDDDKARVERGALERLLRYQSAGKPILAVDYPTDPAHQKRFVELAKKHGFIPYAGCRELDRLLRQPE